MLDNITSDILTILATSLSGISFIGVITAILRAISEIRKVKKGDKVTQETIRDAFASTIIPQNIRINLSEKIKEPLETFSESISNTLREEFRPYIKACIEQQEQLLLILTILSKFAQSEKITAEQKAKLDEILNGCIEVDVK